MSNTPPLDLLSDIFTFEEVKGFGPQKFKELHADGVSLSDVLSHPREMQRFGKRGKDFLAQLEQGGNVARARAMERARKQIDSAKSNGASILTYHDSFYPKVLLDSNIPVPALYARGALSSLRAKKTVAGVGSRNIRAPYSVAHDAFCHLAISRGFAIVSGFATGADIIGHLAADEGGGQTICVMPSGLDRPFPPEHKQIWQRFIHGNGAVFVSEFGFGVGANALNLRKRNKMIAGCALGVLVSQSAEDGGAMNAYRFAMEQKKPVATFQSDGTTSTSGNDLIGGSAEKVNSTVLPYEKSQEWEAWLQKL
jgi:DNA processing protein